MSSTGLHIDRSHGIDNSRWAAQQRRWEAYIWFRKKKKDGQKESVEPQDWTRVRTRVRSLQCWREPTQWWDKERVNAEKCWKASPLVTEECTGGLGGHVNGGINHYWLVPPSLAQPDIPPTIDINHDFSIIDLFTPCRGRMCCLYRFQSLPAPPSRISAQQGDA